MAPAAAPVLDLPKQSDVTRSTRRADGAAPTVVGAAEWRKAREALAAKERQLTRLHDAIVAERQELPWVEVGGYTLQGVGGPRSLEELFGDKDDLIVYHMMYNPKDEDGCPTCSFWVDSLQGAYAHIMERAELVITAAADAAKMDAWAAKRGWAIPVYSTAGSTFAADMGVEVTDEQVAVAMEFLKSAGPGRAWVAKLKEAHPDHPLALYNWGSGAPFPMRYLPGITVFHKRDGKVYKTYAAYARGLEGLQTAFAAMDLLPYGRENYWAGQIIPSQLRREGRDEGEGKPAKKAKVNGANGH
ncbi:hypothetical protein DFJ74DRAFT_775055 [Hyaloraphidium curvatum]|nr:hypothetical protein DFJ74DRAFT_775055 [Hyaloraphidium curvatum]